VTILLLCTLSFLHQLYYNCHSSLFRRERGHALMTKKVTWFCTKGSHTKDEDEFSSLYGLVHIVAAPAASMVVTASV